MLRPAALALAAALTLTACDSQADRPPSRAFLVGVQIEDAPLFDVNGDRWDGGVFPSGPDIYFRVYFADQDFAGADFNNDLLNARDDASFVIPQGSVEPWFSDVEGIDFPLVWAVDGGFELRRLSDELRIVVTDYDPTSGDDVMIATEPFTLGEFAPALADGREDTILLRGVGAFEDEVAVRLRVVYDD
jgi:hypothetical protein